MDPILQFVSNVGDFLMTLPPSEERDEALSWLSRVESEAHDIIGALQEEESKAGYYMQLLDEAGIEYSDV